VTDQAAVYILPPTKENIKLMLPRVLRAPHLCHLVLRNFAFSLPLLTTAMGFNVCHALLCANPPFAYSHLNDMFSRDLQLRASIPAAGDNCCICRSRHISHFKPSEKPLRWMVMTSLLESFITIAASSGASIVSLVVPFPRSASRLAGDSTSHRV